MQGGEARKCRDRCRITHVPTRDIGHEWARRDGVHQDVVFGQFKRRLPDEMYSLAFTCILCRSAHMGESTPKNIRFSPSVRSNSLNGRIGNDRASFRG